MTLMSLLIQMMSLSVMQRPSISQDKSVHFVLKWFVAQVINGRCLLPSIMSCQDECQLQLAAPVDLPVAVIVGMHFNFD